MAESWVEVSSAPGYWVSDEGRVRGKHGKIRKLAPGSYGYLRCEIQVDGRAKWLTVHIEVCKAFHGDRPAGLLIRHLDGDKNNNRKDNLKYGTQKENKADQRRHGNAIEGESHNWAKLRLEDVRDIRRRHASGETPTAIAERYGTTRNYIGDVVARRYWKHAS